MAKLHKKALGASCVAFALGLGAFQGAAFAATAPVAAEGLKGTSTISITGVPTDHIGGNNFAFYKLGTIVSANADAETLVNFDATVTAGYANAMKEVFGGADGNEALRNMLGLESNITQSNGYTGALRTKVTTLVGKLAAGNGEFQDAANAGAVSAAVDRGIYLVIDKSQTGPTCLPMLVTTKLGADDAVTQAKDSTKPDAQTTTLGQVACKIASVDTPTKKIIDSDDSDKKKASTSVAKSDKLHSLLEQTIPHHTANENFWMRLIDHPDENITVHTGEAVVKVNGVVVPAEKYTVETAADGSIAWTVKDKDVALNAGETFSVEVPISLKDALVATGEASASNSVTMIYDANGYNNNDPDPYDPKNPDPHGKELVPPDPITPPDGGTPPDPTGKVTYKVHKLVIDKTDMQGNKIGTATDAAKFTLTRTDGLNTGKGVTVTGGENGVFTQSGYATQATTLAPTGAAFDGTYEIRGLDAGTYTLTETEQPDGFTGFALPSVSIKIADDGSVTKVSGDDNNLVEVTGSAKAGFKVTVKNARTLLEMPMTGAVGIARTAIIALVVFGVGGVLLLVTRRRSDEAAKA